MEAIDCKFGKLLWIVDEKKFCLCWITNRIVGYGMKGIAMESAHIASLKFSGLNEIQGGPKNGYLVLFLG